MHVITRKRLTDFAVAHPDAEGPLDVWYRIAKAAEWRSIADVRETYPHADYVDPFTIFNIKGNAYRLIVKIEYQRQQIYIRSVLSHAAYDRGTWK